MLFTNSLCFLYFLFFVFCVLRGLFGKLSIEHKLVVNGDSDGGSRDGAEHSFAGLKFDGCHSIKFGRDPHGALQVVHGGGLIGLQSHCSGNSALCEFVGFHRRFEAFGEEGGDVFQSEAVVASIPGKSVSAAVLHPRNGAVEYFRSFH